MSQIPIKIVVDAATLLATNSNSGTENSPVQVSNGASVIYMIAPDAFVVNSQANDELSINANVGDQITWQITTIDGGLSYSAILTKYSSSDPNALSNPTLVIEDISYYIPQSNQDPDGPMQKVGADNVVMEATVQQPNVKVTYHWTFKIVDAQGNTHGYYNWDPFINTHANVAARAEANLNR